MPENKRTRLLALAAVVLAAVVFFPVLRNGFITNYDDNVYILQNPFLADFSWETLKVLFSSFYQGNYHPLTMLSFNMDYALGGMNPLFFHLPNYLLHLFNVLLVFHLFRLLTGRADAAFIIALFFGIHPMHVESVAWISERKDVLYAFFFLAACISYLHYIRKPGAYLYLLLGFVLFLFSLLSKSMAVTFPLVMILFDIYEKRKQSAVMWAEKVPFFLLSILFGILAIKSQAGSGAFTDMSLVFSLWQRALIVCHTLAFYIVRLFVPCPLSVIYHYPITGGETALTWTYYVAPLVPVMLAALIWKAKRFRRELIFGLGFFLVTISVVMQIMPVGQAMAADRYTYIPYLGLFFVLARFYTAIKTKEIKTAELIPRLSLIIIVIFVVVFSALSFQRIKAWENGVTLFANQIRNYPEQYYGYYVRATALMESGRPGLESALHDLNTAVKLNPSYAPAYNRRGTVLHKLQRHAEALTDFNTFLSVEGADAQGYSNRGAAKFALGDLQGTIEDCSRAIDLDPGIFAAWINRGNARGMQHDYEGSINDFSEVIRMDPGHALAYLNRGVSYWTLGQQDKACSDWAAADRLGNEAAGGLIYAHCGKQPG